jgi:hypothetical protein
MMSRYVSCGRIDKVILSVDNFKSGWDVVARSMILLALVRRILERGVGDTSERVVA